VGQIDSPNRLSQHFFSAFRASFGEYEKAIGADIVTGVAQAATRGTWKRHTTVGLHPSGFARRRNLHASDFSFVSQRFAGQ
jgi:hypothetical protein